MPPCCSAPRALVALVVLVAFLGCSSPGSSDAARYNLIVVLIDTLRVDHVGAYGYERDTTPNIDRLASRGTLFDWTIAQSNWTVPATATIFTSLHSSQHGARIEGETKDLGSTPPNDLRTAVEPMAALLDRNGFRTGLFSANPFLTGRLRHGFETAVVRRNEARALTDEVLDWLRRDPGRPFFAHLQYMDLHHPLAPPEPYFSYFDAGKGAGERTAAHSRWGFGKLREGAEDPEFQRFRAHKIALYDGALRYVDAQVGRLVKGLEELGILDQTLLVLTSDHGEEFWDHISIERRLGGDPRGIWGIGHGHSMFQELLHIPLIFHGPRVAADRRVSCPARQLDVLPTIVELLGVPEPKHEMAGLSLVAYLQAERWPTCVEVPQVASAPAYGPSMSAIIWKQRKLIVRGDGVELLYDLRADPKERTNLAEGLPDVVAGLRRILEIERQGAASSVAEPEKADRIEYDSETERQLRALGYLGD